MRAMKLPKPTRRDCVAVLVGAALLALVLLLAGCRWRIVNVGAGRPALYVFDRLTGRAWFVDEDAVTHFEDYHTKEPWRML